MAQGLPAPPEPPKMEAPKAPKAPKAPEVPEGLPGGDKKPAPKGPMRKVLDHKKQFVVYPRIGYLRVIGAGSAGSDISHVSVGFDAQVALNKTVYLAAESNLLYISTGEYGLSYGSSLVRYHEGDFTSLTGVGVGLFTSFLDKQELWTHIALKVGYLHPFYLPIWVGGDVEKEFRRSKNSYWVFSLAPALGVVVPLRSPVTRDQYFPPVGADGASEPSAIGVHFFAGAQLSIAFIFAPRS